MRTGTRQQRAERCPSPPSPRTRQGRRTRLSAPSPSISTPFRSEYRFSFRLVFIEILHIQIFSKITPQPDRKKAHTKHLVEKVESGHVGSDLCSGRFDLCSEFLDGWWTGNSFKSYFVWQVPHQGASRKKRIKQSQIDKPRGNVLSQLSYPNITTHHFELLYKKCTANFRWVISEIRFRKFSTRILPLLPSSSVAI